MKHLKKCAYLLLVTCVLLLSKIAEATNNITPMNTLKVGFILSGPITDKGWNEAQNKGRLYLESKLGKEVSTSYFESVPESGQAERIAEKLIANGCKLIFATSYGYLDPVLRVAARHPDVTFMQVGRGLNLTKNVGGYIDKPYQPMYVVGMVAGRMTKVNKIGFIAPHPIPPIIQIINAFELGARSVNPKARLKLVWTNTWADPLVESEATRGLIESGVDVLFCCQGNPLTIVKLAEDKHVFAASTFSDASNLAYKYWITGGVLDWGAFYVEVVKSVMNHSWKSEQINCDMASGVTGLSSFGPQVPVSVRKEAESVERKISAKNFVVFSGPVVDRDGKIRLEKGKLPDEDWLVNMNFFVPGVDGNLPRN